MDPVAMSMAPKKTQGRQKIQMEKIEKESNLLVTFSKRRSGLFKKASELSTLCGVEVAIIVFSPANKVFSFGHPYVDMVVDRFLNQQYLSIVDQCSSSTAFSSHQQQQQPLMVHQLTHHHNTNIYELNNQLTSKINQLEVEKEKSEELTKMGQEGMMTSHSWELLKESIGLEELERLNLTMEILKKDIEEQKKKMIMTTQNVPFGPSSNNADNIAKGSGLQLTMTPHGLVLGREHFSP